MEFIDEPEMPAPATCDVSRISWRDNGTQVGISCGVKHLFNNENEPGQWNSMEIVCSEGLVVVQLNGKIVNWVLNAEQTPGKLAFQSEGGPIEFRNAMLTELP